MPGDFKGSPMFRRTLVLCGFVFLAACGGGGGSSSGGGGGNPVNPTPPTPPPPTTFSVSGEVTEVNSALSDAPATVNEDAMGKGWFAKLKLANKADLDGMMDEAAYKAYVDGLH